MIRFLSRDGERVFGDPRAVFRADRLDQVLPALEAADAGVRSGLWAAGFLAYEAAPAFDPALAVRPPAPGLPLAWFGLFGPPRRLDPPAAGDAAAAPELKPLIGPRVYRQCFDAAQAAIAAGESYQVNLTFPLEGAWPGGDALALWRRLWLAQPCDHAAYMDLGGARVLSVSPEMLFALDGGAATVRPMKGTRPRGLWPAQDRALARELAESPKERAENVMVVDLLRSDLGRVCEPGSVRAARLFEPEPYRTVWQMTSTVEGRTAARVPALLAALFPSGSVTGAPKASSMRLIAALEASPRGAYCGSLGWWAPDGRASFNVAIRTLTLAGGRARYGVGSGVTAAARGPQEWEECLLKAEALRRAPAPDFALVESLLWRPEGGFWLRGRHLDRLEASARQLGFCFDRAAAEAALDAAAPALAALQGEGLRTLRLTLDRRGALALDPHLRAHAPRWRLRLAGAPVDPADPLLYHKTTRRGVFEAALAAAGGAEDVALVNPRGELTETCRCNLALRLGGRLWTPPVECGLLAGTLREEMLANGELAEKVLRVEDVAGAEAVYALNSVRGLVRAEWLG